MECEPGRAAEDEEVATAQLDIGARAGARVAVAETKDAAVAQADGDDRAAGAGRGRRLGNVLVEPEFGCRAVEVDDRRVEPRPRASEPGGLGAGDAPASRCRAA